MKKFIIFAVILCLCLSCFVGCSESGSDKTVGTENSESVLQTTVAVKSDTETALEVYMSGSTVTGIDCDSLLLECQGVSVSVSANSPIDDLESMFTEVEGELPEGAKSGIERKDANVVGIEEKFVYERISSDGKKSFWQFSAESSADTHGVRWLQMDPLKDYDGVDQATINGVSLSSTLSETLNSLGMPSTYGVKVSGGKEVVFLRWDYADMSLYVCFLAEDISDIGSAVVYNIYAQLGSK